MLPPDGGAPPPDSVHDFLGLKVEDLSSTAREALEALEQDGSPGWIAFRWKLTAFTYLVDIFDSPIHDSFDRDPRFIFEQFYPYFESLRLLREAVLCGLNGFTAASTALLRPFLEFSLLQNYFVRIIDASSSFVGLERYLETGTAPSAVAMMRKALPEDDFCKPIRFRITQHLGALSQNALHPYHPFQSHAQEVREVHTHSLESLYSWATTSLVLEAALWAYYVNFPMLFSPVNVMRRFGYNGPVGILIDGYGALAVERSLSKEDYAVFRDYARSQQQTRDSLAFYESRPVLTDEEIRATWNAEDGQFPGLLPAYAQSVAKMRAMKAVMAHRRREEPDKDLCYRLDTLQGWRELARAGAKRR